MKGILISTQPKWVEKILNRIKKDEVRKGTALYKAINKLIAEQGVAPMLIYCTKGNKHECLEYADNPNPSKEGKWVITSGYPYANGKVVARFNATAEEIECLGWDFSYDYHLYRTKELSPRELMLNSQVGYYALEDYLKGKNGTDIHINNLEIFDKPKEISEFHWYRKQWVDCGMDCPPYVDEVKYNLTRAPQSWCYVEVEK